MTEQGDPGGEFRALFDAAAIGLALVDLEGRILVANPALARTLGRDPGDLAGVSLAEVTHPADLQGEAELLSQLGRGRRSQYRLEKRLLRSDGTVVPVRCTVTRMEGGGARTVAAAVVEDLSQALIDELTGLSNRRAFLFFAQQQVKMAYRERRPLTLVLVDVSGMALLNETHGHREGDRALSDVGRILLSTFRASDFVSRVGDDRFAVLLSGESPDFRPALGRLQEAVDAWNRERGRVYELSLRAVTATSRPETPRTTEELLAEAERQLDRARRQPF